MGVLQRCLMSVGIEIGVDGGVVAVALRLVEAVDRQRVVAGGKARERLMDVERAVEFVKGSAPVAALDVGAVAVPVGLVGVARPAGVVVVVEVGIDNHERGIAAVVCLESSQTVTLLDQLPLGIVRTAVAAEPHNCGVGRVVGQKLVAVAGELDGIDVLHAGQSRGRESQAFLAAGAVQIILCINARRKGNTAVRTDVEPAVVGVRTDGGGLQHKVAAVGFEREFKADVVETHLCAVRTVTDVDETVLTYII